MSNRIRKIVISKISFSMISNRIIKISRISSKMKNSMINPCKILQMYLEIKNLHDQC
jgi:hypothetical protein